MPTSTLEERLQDEYSETNAHLCEQQKDRRRQFQEALIRDVENLLQSTSGQTPMDGADNQFLAMNGVHER